MAVYQRKSKENKTGASKKVTGVTETKTSKKSQEELRNMELRQKAMKGFHPDSVTFLKEKLGLDLDRLEVRDLYDLLTGKLTKPLELVVIPMVYDRESTKNVEMPRIKTVASIRVIFPTKNGKQVAPDGKDKRIFVSTVPCRPYIEKAVTPETGATVKAASKDERENPTFTESQIMALEGVGIDRSRLFGGFRYLSKDTKYDILDGKRFYVDGAVRTEFGTVNVIGEARLREENGKPVADFATTYPEEKSDKKVIDLLDARFMGILELDIFRRSGEGRVITNVNGAPMLNRAGENLVSYGMAMEPVRGITHVHKWSDKEKKFIDTIQTAWYQVTAVNGNLFATKMKEVKEKAEGGEEKIRLECAQLRTSETRDKVYLDNYSNEPLMFASERDMDDYMCGKGGVVVGAKFHDFKAKKDLVYDAFVVPDNTRGGLGRQFSPDTSKKLIERRDKSMSAIRSKKQNFGIGF